LTPPKRYRRRAVVVREKSAVSASSIALSDDSELPKPANKTIPSQS